MGKGLFTEVTEYLKNVKMHIKKSLIMMKKKVKNTQKCKKFSVLFILNLRNCLTVQEFRAHINQKP